MATIRGLNITLEFDQELMDVTMSHVFCDPDIPSGSDTFGQPPAGLKPYAPGPPSSRV